MFLYNHFNINEKGHLCMDGADTVDIAREFGTPLYVISRKYIEDAINEYHRIMRENFGDNYTIAYASKALSAKFIYDIIKDMSVHADVVSGGEIYTALAGGMKAEKLVFEDREIPVDGIFMLKQAVAPSVLLYGLETADGHIIVDRACKTNLPGCFAAGDCTGRPYQYVKAAGEGNVAAHSAVEYLAQTK